MWNSKVQYRAETFLVSTRVGDLVMATITYVFSWRSLDVRRGSLGSCKPQSFEVKTSLGALSKYFVGIELDRGVTRRLCNARSGKVGSSHCYLDRRPLHEIATFDEMFNMYDKNILNNWYTLHYQE